MNPPIDLEQLAARMLADYDHHDPGTAFDEDLTLTLDEAYRIQSLVADLRMARGEQVIGYKVGCTSPVIRKRLNAKHPVFGRLFDSECWPSGVSLPATRFANLAIEGELAIRLSHDLSADELGEATIKASIESVFTVIELHNLVFRRDHPSVEELVANNAIHAGFVAANAKQVKLNVTPGELGIQLNEVEVASVPGSQLTQTIIDSLRWLVSELDHNGLSLEAGQTILCGSIADLFPVIDERRINVRAGNFGSVDCIIDYDS